MKNNIKAKHKWHKGEFVRAHINNTHPYYYEFKELFKEMKSYIGIIRKRCGQRFTVDFIGSKGELTSMDLFPYEMVLADISMLTRKQKNGIKSWNDKWIK